MAEKAFDKKNAAYQNEEPKAERPKTAKQKERERKQKEEEEQQTKSVREVYMDLVKTFHPDLEPDDTEKARKTAIMQRVTDAYDRKDLLTLLQLQLEFERIGQAQLEGMADDRLRYFNKVLAEQVRELDEELFRVKAEFAHLCQMHPSEITRPQQVEYRIDREVREVRKMIKALKAEFEQMSNKHFLKAWLKQYQIPKDDFDINLFDIFH